MFWADPSVLRFLWPWALWKATPDAVSLTFDDGPDPEWTPRVLDILGREGVPASFFLTGSKIGGCAGILRRMTLEGHAAGNHGFSHESMAFRRSAWILDEIRRTDEEIENTTGKHPVLFRPPYGRFDPRFRTWMRRTGHTLVMWSLMPGDFLEITPEALTAAVRTRLSAGALIVLHDGHKRSGDMVQALPGILAAIREAGLRVKPLAEEPLTALYNIGNPQTKPSDEA
jgi:peptidoglycan-N-acetylglucosamine deacetylase